VGGLSGVITLLLAHHSGQMAGREPLHSRVVSRIDLVFAGVGWIFVGLGLKSRA